MAPPHDCLARCRPTQRRCSAATVSQAERAAPGAAPLPRGRVRGRSPSRQWRHQPSGVPPNLVSRRPGSAPRARRCLTLSARPLGQCLPRHRHEEFLKFLRTIEREVPAGLAVHLICDNYATHKHPAVRAWLAKHPRFHMHFRRLPLCLGDRRRGCLEQALAGRVLCPVFGCLRSREVPLPVPTGDAAAGSRSGVIAPEPYERTPDERD